MHFSPELRHDGYQSAKQQRHVEPWHVFAPDYSTVPRISLATAFDAEDQYSPRTWDTSPYSVSPTSSPLSHETPSTPLTPSLSSDVGSCATADMSRSSSFSSQYLPDNRSERYTLASYQSSKPRNSVSDEQNAYASTQTHLGLTQASFSIDRNSSQHGSSGMSNRNHHGVAQVITGADGKVRHLLPGKHESASSKFAGSSSSYRAAPSNRKSEFLCNKCNERPQGYRGEHELSRHVKLRHEPIKTMWICVSPPDNPAFLDGCKNCKDCKRYGAYYNAAQHIRRCHFAPIKRGRKSKTETSPYPSKFGNYGNHRTDQSERSKHFPNMAEMKKYLREVITDQDGNILDDSDAVNAMDESREEQAYDATEEVYDFSKPPVASQDVQPFGTSNYHPNTAVDGVNWVNRVNISQAYSLATPSDLLHGVNVEDHLLVAPYSDFNFDDLEASPFILG
jgi:hypothetical protein